MNCQLTKHKFIETQFNKFEFLNCGFGCLFSHSSITIFSFILALIVFQINFNISNKCDHAGIGIDIMLYKYHFLISIYDSRHWDYENNCWKND